MSFHFYSFLKKHKKLFIEGVEKGGRQTIPNPEIITTATPCNQAVLFPVVFEDPFVLSIYWNEDFKNGIVNITLDEFYDNVWNRRLLVGMATPTSISLVEARNGIEGLLTEKCGRFYLQRYRTTLQTQPPAPPLTLNCSDGRAITEEERNTRIGCTPLPPRNP